MTHSTPDQTEKRDVMEIEAPFGWIGRTAEVLIFRQYMRVFLSKKKQELKGIVEKR